MPLWTIEFTPRLKREIARLRDLRGLRFDLDAFLLAVELLCDGKPLPSPFQDHELLDDWAHRR